MRNVCIIYINNNTDNTLFPIPATHHQLQFFEIFDEEVVVNFSKEFKLLLALLKPITYNL